MNLILIQKTYAIIVGEYTKSSDNYGSAMFNMYKFLIQEYRDIIHQELIGKYFSTEKRKELKVVDITFYYNGHITIHGVTHNSPTYRNYAYNEVTFL